MEVKLKGPIAFYLRFVVSVYRGFSVRSCLAFEKQLSVWICPHGSFIYRLVVFLVSFLAYSNILR